MGFLDLFRGNRGAGGESYAAPERKVTSEFVKERGEFAAVVLNAGERLEKWFAAEQRERFAPETDRQYFVRLEKAIVVDAYALYDFLGCYETALYSDHLVGEELRNSSINALRAVMHSREASFAGKPLPKPGPGREPRRPWLVAPPVGMPGQTGALHGPAARDCSRLIQERGNLLEPFKGPRNTGSLPAETPPFIRRCVADGKFTELGRHLLSQPVGPADRWRLHIHPPLAGYLLEWGQEMLRGRGLKALPGRIQNEKALKAAQLLAVSDSRDYLVPDDVKLAILALSAEVFRAGARETARAMNALLVPFL